MVSPQTRTRVGTSRSPTSPRENERKIPDILKSNLIEERYQGQKVNGPRHELFVLNLTIECHVVRRTPFPATSHKSFLLATWLFPPECHDLIGPIGKSNRRLAVNALQAITYVDLRRPWPVPPLSGLGGRVVRGGASVRSLGRFQDPEQFLQFID